MSCKPLVNESLTPVNQSFVLFLFPLCSNLSLNQEDIPEHFAMPVRSRRTSHNARTRWVRLLISTVTIYPPTIIRSFAGTCSFSSGTEDSSSLPRVVIDLGHTQETSGRDPFQELGCR
ncbi:hypothetical protein RSAG8_13154, partial [Rhizoctonia solani AG-8 WAC10335]